MPDQRTGPLVIEPKLSAAIWGGDALVRAYHKRGDADEKLGESWECWDENVVRNGPYKGKSIAELRVTLGKRLMGSLDPNRRFPVLTKIIDARDSLSVQVHPDDAYAQRVEKQVNGKTECWVILAAQTGAELVLGWNRAMNAEEYARRVKDGTLGETLRRVAVKPNDAFYLPAGTLHAIGAGIQLFETQQASNLTYRIFDWNRVGPDGKPRALHIDRAADVLNYQPGGKTQTQHLRYRADGVMAEAYLADARFVVERLEPEEGGAVRPDGEPLILMACERPMHLSGDGFSLDLDAWTTALIPAEVELVELSGSAALSVTPDRNVFIRRLERAGTPITERDAFLKQFGAAPVRV